MDRRAATLLLLALVACSTIIHGRFPESPPGAAADSARPPQPSTIPTAALPPVAGPLASGLPPVANPAPRAEHLIRVALTTTASTARISSTGAWGLYESDGKSFVARGRANEAFRVQHNGSDLRAVRGDGSATPWRAQLVARADDPSALMIVDGKRYAGELRLAGTDDGLQIVDRVPVETYLRGVVPLEIGDRDEADSAAVEAQAVTARSYAYTHLEDGFDQPYDLTAGVNDQVYGGVDAETPVGNEAVVATAGIVVIYGGRIVNAPYHSACGGRTAGAEEVWHTPGEPYLRSVSDRIPGTDRYYCDIAPRFTWTRTLSVGDLNAAVARYLKLYAAVPGGDPGLVRDVAITNRTASGRVATLNVRTTLGSFTLRGNDMRYVLRKVGDEMLNSTYFSLTAHRDDAGDLTRLVIDGRGYGHGVGMCQWGAIGRARAGQDFRTILRTYYPGTALGVVQ